MTRIKIRELTFTESCSENYYDLKIRLLPFITIYASAVILSRDPEKLGWSLGRLDLQLALGLIGLPFMFAGAMVVRLLLARMIGFLKVPDSPESARSEGLYYMLNGPIEEAFFRGFLQSALAAAYSPAVGFWLATLIFVTYHRLSWKSWLDVLSTMLVGIPMGLAFWLMPGPPSLLGISLAHIGATCGFIGPGPYLLRRWGLLE